MAKENVKKFYEEISKNEELQEKFLAAQKDYQTEGKSAEEIFEDIVIPVAKEAGYEFTTGEYKESQREVMLEKGISEEELENVSGGTLISYDYWNNPEAASGAGAIVLPNPILVQPNNSIKIKNMCDVIGFCML